MYIYFMPSNDKEKENNQSESFEDLMRQAEEAVKKLESGKLQLEQSLEVYEGGLRAVKKCREILNNMEMRIKKISKEADGLSEEDVKDKFEK